MTTLKRLVASSAFQDAAGAVAASYLRLVWNTTQSITEPATIYDTADMPAIIALWHGQHFMAPFIKREERGHRVKVLISRHRDGELNARAAERLGIGTIRGSGAHNGEFHRKGGAAAFSEMLDALAQGYNVALTADVPKVARVAGLGVVKLAQHSGTADLPRGAGDPAPYRAEELGPHGHQSAVRPHRHGRGRTNFRRPRRRRDCTGSRETDKSRTNSTGPPRVPMRSPTGLPEHGRERVDAGSAARLPAVVGDGDAIGAVISGAAAAPRQGTRRPARRAARRERHPPSTRCAGLGARGQRRRNRQRAAADRAAARARLRRAGHVGHRHLGRSRRAAAAGGRHPPVRAARCTALRAPLHRALAAGTGAVRRSRTCGRT